MKQLNFILILLFFLSIMHSKEIQKTMQIGELYTIEIDQESAKNTYKILVSFDKYLKKNNYKFDINLGYDIVNAKEQNFNSINYHSDNKFQVEMQKLERNNIGQTTKPKWTSYKDSIPQIMESTATFAIEDLKDDKTLDKNQISLTITIPEKITSKEKYEIFIGTRLLEESYDKNKQMNTRCYKPLILDYQKTEILQGVPLHIYPTDSFTNIVNQKHEYHFAIPIKHFKDKSQILLLKSIFQNNSVGGYMKYNMVENLSNQELEKSLSKLIEDYSDFPTFSDQENQQLFDLASENKYGSYVPYYTYTQFQNEQIEIDEQNCIDNCLLQITVLLYTGNVAYRHERQAYIDYFIFNVKNTLDFPVIDYSGKVKEMQWDGLVTKNNKSLVQTIKAIRKKTKLKSDQSIEVQGCVVQDPQTEGKFRICEYVIDQKTPSKNCSNNNNNEEIRTQMQAPHTLMEEQILDADIENFYIHIVTSYTEIDRFIFDIDHYSQTDTNAVSAVIQDLSYSEKIKYEVEETVQAEQMSRVQFYCPDDKISSNSFKNKVKVKVNSFLTFKDASLTIQNFDDPQDFKRFDNIHVDTEYSYILKEENQQKVLIILEPMHTYSDPKKVKEPLAVQLQAYNRYISVESGFPSNASFIIVCIGAVLLSFLFRYLIERSDKKEKQQKKDEENELKQLLITQQEEIKQQQKKQEQEQQTQNTEN